MTIWEQVRADISKLRAEIAELRSEVAALRGEIAAITAAPRDTAAGAEPAAPAGNGKPANRLPGAPAT